MLATGAKGDHRVHTTSHRYVECSFGVVDKPFNCTYRSHEIAVPVAEPSDPRIGCFAAHVAWIFASVQRKRSLKGLKFVLDTAVQKPMQGFGLRHDSGIGGKSESKYHRNSSGVMDLSPTLIEFWRQCSMTTCRRLGRASP